MYSPQSLHRWGITHSESMERLAYCQGKTHQCSRCDGKEPSATLKKVFSFDDHT